MSKIRFQPTDPFENRNPSHTEGERSTELLVSVRDLGEVQQLLSFVSCGGKVQILDLKEPLNGPLAPASPKIWWGTVRCCAVVEDPPRLSAALGEWIDAKRVAPDVPGNFAFAKVGPSGCATVSELERCWDDVRTRLDSQVELVAVAYADHVAASSLPPDVIFERAARNGFRRCLLDTFTKTGRSSHCELGSGGLLQIGKLAAERGLVWTLAGSMRVEMIPTLAEQGIRPDGFGVRGDVCVRGRTSQLDSQRLSMWSNALARS